MDKLPPNINSLSSKEDIFTFEIKFDFWKILNEVIEKKMKKI